MSIQINHLKGSWTQIEEGKRATSSTSTSLEANKNEVIVNKIAAKSLISRGTQAINNLFGRKSRASVSHGESSVTVEKPVENSVNGKEEVQDIKGSYQIVSWNVATLNDYSNMCFIRNKMNKQVDFLGAYNELLSGPPYRATKEEQQARVTIFQEAVQQFGNPDIICLQETVEMKPQDLEEILPSGYTFFSDSEAFGEHNCTVVWNSEKFSLVAHAHLIYDPERIPSFNSAPDTIVLLRDNTNGTTICVGSAHLRGFSLAYDSFEKERRDQELGRAGSGDNQARYDLSTMDAQEADLYVFAGDFNVTRQHYQPRLDIIGQHGYIADGDDSPTIYDANLKEEDGVTPKAARLDYIFVKGRENLQVAIEKIHLKRTEVGEFNSRASDHLPVGSQVSYGKLVKSTS